MNYLDAMSSASESERGQESWETFVDHFNDSLDRLEAMIDDVGEMQKVCRDEWCEATECLLQEATVAAFAISEPHWASREDSRRLKELKERLHDLYSERRGSLH